MNQNQLILLIVVVLVVAAVAIFTLKTRRTKRLRARFGPEYGRAVQESGNAERGERSNSCNTFSRRGKMKLRNWTMQNSHLS